MTQKMGKNQLKDDGLRSTVALTLLKARQAFFGVGVFSFFINLLMLTGPIYMLQVYDRVLISRSLSTLIAISVLMASLYAFMGILDFIRSRVLVRVAREFEKDLGERTFGIWLKQGLVGQAAQRHAPLNDLSTIRQFLSGNGPGTIFDVPWVPVYIAAIFFLHWTLGLIAVAGAIVIVCIALRNELGSRTPLIESLKLRRIEQTMAQQSHRNADVIEAMGMSGQVINRWKQLNQKYAVEAEKSSDKSGGSSATTKAFRMFIQSAILGAGGALAVQQIVTPGAMIAGSIILGRALAPLQMIIGQWRSLTTTRDSYSRLNKFYKAVPEEEESTSLPAPKGLLSVENIIAGAPGARTAILRGLNFKLKPGEGLGVVGPSASGKSTLARLLVGIWLPQQGAVRLDGATFDQYNRDEVGPYIGYLPQTVELLDGTIGENIARFDPQATDENIVLAARRAGVHEMILRLPDGYDSRIGEGGTVLSGGQNQRVGLARALYGEPALIVLDEPNSSLDAEGDQALARAIAGMRKMGKTIIVMAHRPSAIAAVDKLLYIKDGQQLAFGDKDEVLAQITKSNQAQTKTNKEGAET